MSPRAAWRLEELGFPDVAQYAGGIADWMASGLPIEGSMADDAHVAAVARTDVPTCGPRDTVADARTRLRGTEWDTCFVLNEDRILLGRLYVKDLEQADPAAPAEDVMHPGPVTYRPDFLADQLLDVMEQRDLETAPVTTSDGVFVGLAHRADLERAVSRAKERSRANRVR